MSKKIECVNEDNVSVIFQYDFDPFFLLSCEGIYSISNNVVTSENTMVDGATYQGSTTTKRNIVITAQMEKDYKKNRDYLYKVFKPKATGSFKYTEDNETRTIDYKVEKLDIDEVGVVRDIVISLLCPDPFFKGLEDTIVTMSSWVDNLEFPFEILEAGVEFGYRSADAVKNIENDSAADNIGLTIIFKADGAVKNPALYHSESGEFIKVGYDEQPFIMQSGDEITITTETNDKKVELTRNGITEEINEYLDERSEFIQLQHGKNTLTYTADDGLNFLNAEIRYRLRYLGV